MFSFSISIAGIVIRFLFPNHLHLPEIFHVFHCDDAIAPDFEFEIQLIDTPIPLPSVPVYTGNHMKIYQINEDRLRVYTPLIAEDGCQVACLLSLNGKNKLYYPASRWEHFSSELRCFHLIGAEALLLQHQAFLLHSSLVFYKEKAILFSGPSGIGKSTQADLWQKHMGAKIINGDRCVVIHNQQGFYGSGSPWAGTSGIYHNEQAPIAGIVILNQSEQNRIRRLGFEAFPALFSQTTINSWDEDFMSKITLLYHDLFRQVPIYALDCRPDEDAVHLVHKTMF